MKVLILILLSITSARALAFREICMPINRNYINRSYEGNLSYDLYTSLINMKKVYFPKGTHVQQILEESKEYLYEPLDRWVKHFIYKNGLTSNILKKGMRVVYPFCQQDFLPIKTKKKTPEVIQIAKQEKREEKESKFQHFWKRSDFKFGLGANTGSEELDGGGLDYSVFRAFLSYSYKINKKYDFIARVTGSSFRDADFEGLVGQDISSETIEPSLSLRRGFGKWGAHLDYKNVVAFREGSQNFLTQEIDLVRTNYFGLRGTRSLFTHRFRAGVGAGFLQSDQGNGLGGLFELNYDILNYLSLGFNIFYKSFSDSDSSLQTGINIIYNL